MISYCSRRPAPAAISAVRTIFSRSRGVHQWSSSALRVRVVPGLRPSLALRIQPCWFTRGISRNSAIAKGLRESVRYDRSNRRQGTGDGVSKSGMLLERKDGVRLNRDRPKGDGIRSGREDGDVQLDYEATSQQRGRRVRQDSERKVDEDQGYTYALLIPRTKADSEFVIGRRSVLSALKAGKRTLYKLFVNPPRVATTKPDRTTTEIMALAKDAGIPVVHDRQAMAAIARREEVANATVAGVILEASALPQPELAFLRDYDASARMFRVSYADRTHQDVAASNNEDGVWYEQGWAVARRSPFILWLHGVTDTGNIGSIMRTAVYMGVDAILLSVRSTGAITTNSHVTATGATEFANLFRVRQPKDFIEQSRANGWRFYASVRPAASPADMERTAFGDAFEDRGGCSPLADHPCVVILGNETEGLPDWMAAKADERISIGGPSRLAEKAGVDSFNVSVAAALLSERFLREPTAAQLESSRELPNSRSQSPRPRLDQRDLTRLNPNYKLRGHR